MLRGYVSYLFKRLSQSQMVVQTDQIWKIKHVMVRKKGSFAFVPPQYVMLPPITEHVRFHSK